MEYTCLPEEIQKIVKKPFVFISYCYGNKDVYNRVQQLVLYLRNRGISILYDEGGLNPGTELTQFENLILDENCKYVLVVCDKCYLDKVENNQGGSWREYFNISNDYTKHKEKYIPLIVDAEIPIFSGKVYNEFKNSSKDELKQIEKALSSLQKRNKRNKDQIETLIKEANSLCDENNYNAADKKITEVIEIYRQQARTKKSTWACLYNLKLYICIKRNDVKNAVTYANDLLKVINDRLDYDKRTTYYGNCALAFRLRDNESNEYEVCSKSAYQMAKKGGNEELYYYASMYATALFETEQFTNAFKIAKEALDDFCNKNKDITQFTKEKFIMYIKLKGNIAEIAVNCSKNKYESRKRKLEFLMEAQKNIIETLNLNMYEKDESIELELYSIASIVFSELKNYYSF